MKALLLWSHFTDEEGEAGRLELEVGLLAPLRCTAPDVDMGHELPGACRPGGPSCLPALPGQLLPPLSPFRSSPTCSLELETLASTFSAHSASLTLPACWCCALHGLVRVSVQESRRAECLLGSGCAALGCSDSQHRPPEPPHVFWGRWDSQERTGDLGEDGSASGSRLFLALVSSSPNL